MPNLVPPLDESQAYVHCPACRDNGTPNVPLKREMHKFCCPFQHTFDWLQLQRMHAEMVPMSAILKEQPNPTAIKWPVWVMPQTKTALEEKLAGRLYTTIGTMLDLLADDAILFIQGSEAAELRKRGLVNGSQILSALDSFKQMEKERSEAVERLERMQQMLRSTVGEG